MIRTLLALAGMAALLLGAISHNSSASAFIDLPSLVMVVGVVGAGTVASFPSVQLQAALRPGGADPVVRAAVFHRMADLAVASGMVGSLVGVVKMLQSMADPSALGPAMAQALLTMLYGIGLGELVCRSLASGGMEPGALGAGRRGQIYLPLAVSFVVAFVLVTMMVSFADRWSWNPT
jgi:flagellar motor component MotA